MPNRLTRNEFTQSLKDKKLDVADATRDPRLAGVDVAKADLNRDGAISGEVEAAALFKVVDAFDRNGDSASIALRSETGAATKAATVAAALQARAVFQVTEGPVAVKDAALKSAFPSPASLPLARGQSGDRAVAVQYALARLGVDVGSGAAGCRRQR